jgi:hypothetical protein
MQKSSPCQGIHAVRIQLSTLDIGELSPLSCLFLQIVSGLNWYIRGALAGFLRWWYTLVYCKIYIVIGCWKWRKPLCHEICISHAILRSMKGNLSWKCDRLKNLSFQFNFPNAALWFFVYSRRQHGTYSYGVKQYILTSKHSSFALTRLPKNVVLALHSPCPPYCTWCTKCDNRTSVNVSSVTRTCTNQHWEYGADFNFCIIRRNFLESRNIRKVSKYFLLFQLMHTYKIVEMLKNLKNYDTCSDMFRFTQEPSSGSSPVLS